MKLVMALLTLITGAAVLLSPAPVLAADVFNEACKTGVGTSDSAACKDRNVFSNPISGRDGILLRVVRLIAIATGTIAVIMIIVSGIRFVTSHGDPQSVNAAKNTILYAVIGLIVIVLAQAIIAFVVNRI